MHLLPRRGSVHYTAARGETAHELVPGDRVYVNREGRLLPLTLIERQAHRCIGLLLAGTISGQTTTDRIEFDMDAIYVVQKGN